jgi:hypothetical protein
LKDKIVDLKNKKLQLQIQQQQLQKQQLQHQQVKQQQLQLPIHKLQLENLVVIKNEK